MVLGAGFSGAGLTSGGYGSPTETIAVNNREWSIPGTNASGNGKYINPETLDYEVNQYGLFIGQSGAEQQVYLALATVRGSAAQYNMGQTLYQTRTIAGNYQQLITSQINQALSDLISSKTIILNSVETNRNKVNQLIVVVSWTDPNTQRTYKNTL